MGHSTQPAGDIKEKTETNSLYSPALDSRMSETERKSVKQVSDRRTYESFYWAALIYVLVFRQQWGDIMHTNKQCLIYVQPSMNLSNDRIRVTGKRVCNL